MSKITTYWRVRSSTDGSVAPWEELPVAPATTEGLVGHLRVENDDQIMWIFFEDEIAQAKVTTAAQDVTALAREWEIPHQPYRDPLSDVE